MTEPPLSVLRKTTGSASSARRVNGLTRLTGDQYVGGFPVAEFEKQGITLKKSERTKSQIYIDGVPAMNSGLLRLPDHPGLKTQFLGLERQVMRGGRESIDHGPNGHDDIANAAMGALTLEAPKHDDLGCCPFRD